MDKAFKINIDADNIAWIFFDLPGEKVNKLAPPALQELSAMIDSLAQNKTVKALVIKSGKPDTFVAGADLKIIAEGVKDPKRVEELIELGHSAFRKIELLPFPTFAAINGVCVGGGMELALACTYRIVSDSSKTQLGLPEVSLGIFPGWGGTQRMPRLVGVEEALQLILTGRSIKPTKAWKIKLADAIVPAEFFDQKVKEFVLFALTPKGKEHIQNKRKHNNLRTLILEKNPLGRKFLFWQAKKNLLAKTKGHYPSPLVALELIERSYTMPLEKGLAEEKTTFTKSIPGNFTVAKHLIALFFAQENLKKYTGVPEKFLPEKINSTAVLGAGTMGGTIAWLISDHDIPVRLKDINWEAIGKGYASAFNIFTKMVRDKKLKKAEASLKFHQLSATVDYSGFKNVDLVIEAAVENLELKKRIFAELEQQIRPDAIVASNTSSLTIAEMGENMKNPERLVGMHFFNPPNKMPLVEIVKGPKTSLEVIATAVDFCKKLGKTPLVVGDCHGFLVNRIFAMGANEALWLLEQGIPMETLENTMLRFGMPMGPFTLADEVGNDVSYKVSLIFEKAYGERMQPPPLLSKMNENKFYGKKVDKGFYLYTGKTKKANPAIKKLLPMAFNKNITENEITDRILFTMINEAARCLEENIVDTPEHLDMAMIMGIGFPPFRGGLLRYADEIGIAYITEKLNAFTQKYGKRFTPCQLILDMQKSNRQFYDGIDRKVQQQSATVSREAALTKL